ncbi:MAG: DUF819 family protein [Congregibacter sp.]
MTDEFTGAAIVALTVSAVLWLSRQTHPGIRALLQWFPAILFAYVIPALFTQLFSLDLGGISLHQLSSNWVIPLAIVSVMSALPLAQLKVVGARPLVVFVIGSFVIATLPVFLVFIFSMIDENHAQMFIADEYWKGLVPIVGGWIGGSTSQLVLKEVINTPEGLFLSILVLDNVLVNIWTILMFQFIRRTPQLNAACGIHDEIRLLDTVKDDHGLLKPWIMLLVLLGFVAGANALALPFLWKVLGLSAAGLLLVNVIRSWNVGFVLRVGGIAIILIMAILGLKLNFSNFSLPGALVILVVIWLLLHYVFMLLAALLLRLNLAWVPIASMANLGGISTAPAVTSAYRRDLMPHAILLAILSMVSGTAWGLLSIQLFEWVFAV